MKSIPPVSHQRPGATRIEGNQSPSSHDVISDDESSNASEQEPVLEAELAPDIAQIVEDALQQNLPLRRPCLLQADLVAPTVLTQASLAFLEPTEEERFQKEHADLIRLPGATYCIVVLVLNFFLYFWDLVQPGVGWSDTVWIRVLVFVTMASFAVCFLYVPQTKQWYQYMIFAYTNICMFFACCLLREVTDGFVVDLSALSLTYFAILASCMMQFRVACAASVTSLAMVNIFILLQEKKSGMFSNAYVFANANVILVLATGLGLAPLCMAEMYLRHRFLRTGTISYWIHPDEERHKSVEMAPV